MEMTAKQFKEDIKALKESGVLTECETYLLGENETLKKQLGRAMKCVNGTYDILHLDDRDESDIVLTAIDHLDAFRRPPNQAPISMAPENHHGRGSMA